MKQSKQLYIIEFDLQSTQHFEGFLYILMHGIPDYMIAKFYIFSLLRPLLMILSKFLPDQLAIWQCL